MPKIYEATQARQIVELMRSSPLALLITNGAADIGPSATHLPVVMESVPEDGGKEGLVGATLLGHMNRANPSGRRSRRRSPGYSVSAGRVRTCRPRCTDTARLRQPGTSPQSRPAER